MQDPKTILNGICILLFAPFDFAGVAGSLSVFFFLDDVDIVDVFFNF